MFNEIRKTLIDTVIDTQASSGRAVPQGITGSTCPMNDLQGFDSLIAVEVTAYVSTKLGVRFEPTLMLHSHYTSPYTIDQIAEKIIEILNKEKTNEEEEEEENE